jgi:prophage regulatory protein
LTSYGEAAINIAIDQGVFGTGIYDRHQEELLSSSFCSGEVPMIESPFLLLPEVDKISRLSDLTRWRLEKSGRFPKRVKIAGRKVAWRKSEIEAWVADPEGWARRHNTHPYGR